MRIQTEFNRMPPSDDRMVRIMADEEIRRARAFHESFPEYEITPLADLPQMSLHLGVSSIKVKDESWRFGLNAFKVLGGSYALARFAAQELGIPADEITYERLKSPELRDFLSQVTILTATDGNHGRGLAWAARQLGCRCIVKMPAGTTEIRYQAIKAEGAEVTIESVNYDECVRMAAALADEIPHSVVIQDTAWEGYEDIPTWIMQGYGTMAQEAAEQCGEAPTHIFLQAGVGSMAGAVTGYFACRYPENPPKVIIVEPENAACCFASAKRRDGSYETVGGALETISAGLACGEVNYIGWDILRNHAACFAAVEDAVTARGMRMLAAPIKGDPQVIAGESGAPGFALLAALMTDAGCHDICSELGLGPESRILCFSTEGNTDPERYENIVWKGLEK